MGKIDSFEAAEEARSTCHYKKAGKLYQKALKERKVPQAWCYMGLGDCYRMQGDFPMALKHYQRVLDLTEEEALYYEALVGKALALRALCCHEEGLSLLRQALTYYEKEEDLEGLAYLHWALGGTLRLKGAFLEGVSHLKKALELHQAIENTEGLTYAYCALGGIHRILGAYDESWRYYHQAHQLAKKREDRFAIAYSHCGLGNVFRMQERWEEGLNHFYKAEKHYQAIGDRISYAYTLFSMGMTYGFMGEKEKSLKTFDKAFDYFTQTRDPRGKAYVWMGKALLTRDKDAPHQALALTKRYHLPWENLLAKITLAELQDDPFIPFESALRSFQTRWQPQKGKVNIP